MNKSGSQSRNLFGSSMNSNLTKSSGLLLLLTLFLSCSNNQTTDIYNSEIFLGKWTQVKNYNNGSSGHLSEIGYGEFEIHFVTQSKWIQYINMHDSVICWNWTYFVRNDSLIRSPDDSNYYYVGIISKSNDRLIINKDNVTLWLAPYQSDSLPENWSKNIVYRNSRK